MFNYLEDKENFQQIFGSRSQTLVGPAQIKHGRAYERMAKYINIITGHLHLSGTQMCQQLVTSKLKYCWAKDFENIPGATIEEQEQNLFN